MGKVAFAPGYADVWNPYLNKRNNDEAGVGHGCNIRVSQRKSEVTNNIFGGTIMSCRAPQI